MENTERLDDLQLKGYRIWQDSRLFCFSVDAVLLADFATVRKGDRVCDLCSGNGIIPILLAANTRAAHITGVEIQEPSWKLALRSMELNGLQERVDMRCMDAMNAPEELGRGRFQAVLCNPPFKPAGDGIPSQRPEMYIARHEALIQLDGILQTASALLCPLGRFAIIHRPERLSDLLCGMRRERMEPKRLRMVQPTAQKAPTMVLVEGVKDARPGGLQVEPPLVVHDGQGGYTQEIRRIYRRDEWEKKGE
ncbi:MAG: tRNA1(Val) (adenine(37)-N6)-methyltransferase [Eubacteriales bacterium]|jgi:tRNA1Val (adenine37-N6)-methyltransferase